MAEFQDRIKKENYVGSDLSRYFKILLKKLWRISGSVSQIALSGVADWNSLNNELNAVSVHQEYSWQMGM